MKTIIKGIKEVKRLNGIIYKDDKMPVLNYKNYTLESDEIIQKLDFELITNNSVEKSIWYGALVACMPNNPCITIYDSDGLQSLAVLKESITDCVKTIIVNKVLANEEQKFNYDEIMARYNEEFETYYAEFMKQFENDKPMQITIRNWIDGGMSREDVVTEIKRVQEEMAKRDNKSVKCCTAEFATGGVISCEGRAII